MEIAAVRLEMDYSSRFEEVTVSVHEQRSCQTFLLASYLRICKCYPDLGNLICSKQGFNEFYARAEEADIGQRVLRRIFRAFPESCTLYIDADIIERGITLCKVDSIVPFTAAKLQNYRIVIAEEIATPVPFQIMVATENLRGGRLDQTPESLIFTEFP